MAKPFRAHIDIVLGHHANTITRSYSPKRRWDQFLDELSSVWHSWLLSEGDHTLRERILNAPQTKQDIDALERFQQKKRKDGVVEEINAEEASELGIFPAEIGLSSTMTGIPLEKALEKLRQKKITPKQVDRLGFHKKTFGIAQHTNDRSTSLSFMGEMRLYFDTGSAGKWESRFLKISKTIALVFAFFDAVLMTAQRTLYFMIDTLEWTFRFWPFDNYARPKTKMGKFAPFTRKEVFFLSTSFLALAAIFLFIVAPLILPAAWIFMGVSAAWVLTSIIILPWVYGWTAFAVETWSRHDISTGKKWGIIAASLVFSPLLAVGSVISYALAFIKYIPNPDEYPNYVIKSWRPSRYVHLPETREDADIANANTLGRPLKNGWAVRVLKGLIALPFLIVRAFLFAVYKLFDVSGEGSHWLNISRVLLGTAAVVLGVVGSVILGWSLITVALPLIAVGVLFGLFYLITKSRNDYPLEIRPSDTMKPYFVRRQLFLKEGPMCAEYAAATDVLCSKIADNKESKRVNPVTYTVIETGEGEYEIFSKEKSEANEPYKKTFYVKQIGEAFPPEKPIYDIYCTYELNLWHSLRIGHSTITLRYTWNKESENYEVVSALKNEKSDRKASSSLIYEPGPEDSLNLADALYDLAHVFPNQAYGFDKLSKLSKQDALDVLTCVAAGGAMKPDLVISPQGGEATPWYRKKGIGYACSKNRPGRYFVNPMHASDNNFDIPGTDQRAIVEQLTDAQGKPAGIHLTTKSISPGCLDAKAQQSKELAFDDKCVHAFADMSEKDISFYGSIKLGEQGPTIKELYDQLQNWRKDGGELEDPRYQDLKRQCLNMLRMLSDHEKLEEATKKMIFVFLKGHPRDGAFFRAINVMEKAVRADFGKWEKEHKDDRRWNEINLCIGNLQFAEAMNMMYPKMVALAPVSEVMENKESRMGVPPSGNVNGMYHTPTKTAAPRSEQQGVVTIPSLARSDALPLSPPLSSPYDMP